LGFFIGIDLGTSSVKAVLVDDRECILATSSAPLYVQRPAPGFSEQAPEAWLDATLRSVDALAAKRPKEIAAVTGIGLSGQMHGATLLDVGGTVLRPCILWNDIRSAEECDEFEAAFPRSREITGNLAMRASLHRSSCGSESTSRLCSSGSPWSCCRKRICAGA
jgi:xylulokinase